MKRLARVIFAGLIVAAAASAAQERRDITIGTGGVTGVYYPAGAALCRQMSRQLRVHEIGCTVESTPGSVYNVNSLRQGTLDFAISQADVQYNARDGSEGFSDQGPFEGLRSVFSLHIEPFTVVARPDSGVRTFSDLKGKRVNIGNPGSGQRSTMERLMAQLDWTRSDFAAVSELKSTQQAGALCSGEIDAFVFSVGHPSGSITEAVRNCSAMLVPVSGVAVDELVTDHPYYRKTAIAENMYEGINEPVETFGGYAALLTTDSTPEDIVYALVKSVFDDFQGFVRLHPAFAALKPETMITEGIFAPLHDGAVRYYKERGWM